LSFYILVPGVSAVLATGRFGLGFISAALAAVAAIPSARDRGPGSLCIHQGRSFPARPSARSQVQNLIARDSDAFGCRVVPRSRPGSDGKQKDFPCRRKRLLCFYMALTFGYERMARRSL